MGVMGAKQQAHAYTNNQINIESMYKIHTYKLHMIPWSKLKLKLKKKKPLPDEISTNSEFGQKTAM